MIRPPRISPLSPPPPLSRSGTPPRAAGAGRPPPAGSRPRVRDAISREEPVWLDGQQPHDYVIMREATAAASLPLRHGDRAYGGMVLLWEGTHRYPDTERRYLTGLASLAGRRFRQLARAAGKPSTPGHWLQGVLDA